MRERKTAWALYASLAVTGVGIGYLLGPLATGDGGGETSKPSAARERGLAQSPVSPDDSREAAPANVSHRRHGRNHLEVDLQAVRSNDTPSGEELQVRLRVGSFLKTPLTVKHLSHLVRGDGTEAIPDTVVSMGLFKPGEQRDSEFSIGPLPEGFYHLRVTATAQAEVEDLSIVRGDSLYFAVEQGTIRGFMNAGEWYDAGGFGRAGLVEIGVGP